MFCKLLGWTFSARQLFFKCLCQVTLGLKILAYNYLKASFFRPNMEPLEKDSNIWFGLVTKRAWWMQQSAWLGVLTLVWKEKVF